MVGTPHRGMSSSNANNTAPVQLQPEQKRVVQAAKLMARYQRLEGCIDEANRLCREIDLIPTYHWMLQVMVRIDHIRALLLRSRHMCSTQGRYAAPLALRRFFFPMPPPSWRRHANGGRLARDPA
eukprot:1421961-Rhodomonas_salina.1